MYKFHSHIESGKYTHLLKNVEWSISKGPEVDYATAEIKIDTIEGKRVNFARLIKIPPQGYIKRHSDNGGRPKGIKVYHLVLKTNKDCLNISYSDEDQRIHLPINTMWLFDTLPEHESFNKGSTERIHLVIDSYD